MALLLLLPLMMIPEMGIGARPSEDELGWRELMTELKWVGIVMLGLFGAYLAFSGKDQAYRTQNRRLALVAVGFFLVFALVGMGFPLSDKMSIWRRSEDAFSSYCQQHGMKVTAYYRTLKSNKMGYSYSEYAPREVGARADYAVKAYWFGPAVVERLNGKG